MAAIGREGGHSRGARARAAASNMSSGNTDVAQNAGSQPFVREATDSNRPAAGGNSGFGSQERSGSRDERSSSSSDEGGSFSSNRDGDRY